MTARISVSGSYMKSDYTAKKEGVTMKNDNKHFSAKKYITLFLIVSILFSFVVITMKQLRPITARADRLNASVTSYNKTDASRVSSIGNNMSAMLNGKNIYCIIAESGYMTASKGNREMISLERTSVFDHTAQRMYTPHTKQLSPIAPKYEDVSDPNSPLMGSGGISDDILGEEDVQDQSDELIELDAPEPGYKTNETENDNLIQ